MTDWYQHVECILAFGGSGRIGARGCVNVKAGLIGQVMIYKYLIKRGFIVAAQKDIVMGDLWVFFINTPVEHDGRAGVQLIVQFFRFNRIG